MSKRRKTLWPKASRTMQIVSARDAITEEREREASGSLFAGMCAIGFAIAFYVVYAGVL